MSRNKFYVKVKISTSNKPQVISLKRMKEIQALIPKNEILMKHLMNQKIMKDGGAEYKPFDVQVSEVVFDRVAKQILDKSPYGRIENGVFEVVSDSKLLPLVKIFKK